MLFFKNWTETNFGSYYSIPACRLLERQVVAIYGPTTPNAVDVVQSLTTQFGIPHLQIDWGFRQKIHGFALNVHPHYLAYGQALYDYVRAAEWPSVALIYYKEESELSVAFFSFLTYFMKLPICLLLPVYASYYYTRYW